MLNKQFASIITIALSVLSVSDQALGRYRWLERDNKPILLHPRRFGQQNPEVLTRLGSACSGQVCGVLAGRGPSTLLGAAGECEQQDLADDIIDAAQQFDDTTKANLISLAVEFRQVEKNTPPDFTTNPETLRNSVFCQTAPRNSELDGLVQAQDPANDPNIFFDPALGKSVTLGSQANTFPFGTSGSSGASAAASDVDSAAASPTAISAAVTDDNGADDEECTIVTVTVAGAVAAASSATGSSATVTVDVSDSAATPTTTASSSDIGDFGSCSVPEIEFGTGFDGRTETSFQPADKASFNHGSAQNIDIITQFICDQLTNSCGADQTAKDTCASAEAAASAATKGTGEQADAFNAVFGITTNFAAVAAVDNQGNVVAGTGSGADSSDTSASSTDAADDSGATAAASTTDAASTAAASDTTGSDSSSSSSGIGDFGSCSVPEIEFGTGFDNRRETSFQPVDKASFNHGSAQNINIITQFICDTLTNSCGADQTAKDTCASAQSAASAAAAKTGAQADAFNAVFGITTNFASVAVVDDQGNVVSSGTDSGASDGASSDAASTTAAVASTTAAAATAAASATASASTTGSDTGSGENLQTFSGSLGDVTAPTVTALGDGRFQVEGNSAFNSLQSALVRSCDVQNNQCANAANSSGNQGDLTVANCNAQQQECISEAQSAASS